jgi:von Willebrand factor type A domain
MNNDFVVRFSLLPLAALAASATLAACGKDDDVFADPTSGTLDPSRTGRAGADASVLPPAPPSNSRSDAGSLLPPPGCYSTRVQAHANKPDIMIVLDRSQSMQMGQRWEPSKNAIKSITGQFQAFLDFGLTMFPGVGDVCAAGAVDVPMQSNNAPAIGSAADATRPQGYTPLGATLEVLASVLGDRTPPIDGRVKPAYVLLVTDGEPTCEADGMRTTPTTTSIERANVAVEQLKAQSVPTYVIGYSVANAAGVMDGLAQRGGTEHYFPVENEAQLVEQFAKITAVLASCDYELHEVPANPGRVRVLIDGNQVYLSDSMERGFVLDGKTIRLQGGSCQALRDGAPHSVEVTVECQDIRPGA